MILLSIARTARGREEPPQQSVALCLHGSLELAGGGDQDSGRKRPHAANGVLVRIRLVQRLVLNEKIKIDALTRSLAGWLTGPGVMMILFKGWQARDLCECYIVH